ncbi:EamA family transporter [Croceicoccus naphthovorans]|uniref:EamA family transporter n=1 Tax=Croceicoccus naphthovorans TaxID=1348774 RepID=UPI00146FEA32|nr:EamA family transporter [Croceicoccus naphthovorans]MBB3990622.1 drug/metabolite transporter (DMT)-like permease [Croceicoccus naphthovorans]
MHQDERMGVLFAILGYVLLSMGDSVWKLVADAWAPTALATWRYSLGAVGLGAALWWREGALGFRVRNPWVQLMRGSGVAIATASFVTAVGMMPLVDTTAILFTSPLLTALLAAVFLRRLYTLQTHRLML